MAEVRYLGIGKEASFGSPATPTRYLDPKAIAISTEKAARKRRGVATRWPTAFSPGKVVVRGSFDYIADPETIGDILLMLLGKVTTTQPDATNAPNTYQHVFEPVEVNQVPPSYTLEIGSDITARRVVGAIAASLTLELPKDDFVGGSVEILAKQEDSAALSTPTWPQPRPWTDDDASIDIGGAAAELEALTLEVNNNPSEDHHVIGSRFLPRHELGELEIRGSMDIRFSNRTHLDRFLNDQETSLKITLTGDPIEATYNHKLEIWLPRIIYDAWSGEVNPSERLVQGIDFVAIKPATADPIIKATLVNKVSAY